MKKCERIDIYLYTYLEANKDGLIGAVMHIYEPDTTNPKNIYSDSSRDNAIANPLVADEIGEFPKSFIDKPYKVVICNRFGSRIFEDDYEEI